jgi:hypothetical protein
MSSIAVVGSSASKDSQTLVFSGATVDEIADKAALFLAARGYKLETGSKTQGVYGRGSAAGRVIFGALAKRLKLNLTVGKDGDNVALVLAKGMSGMSGGLIGMSQEKKELQAVITGLQGAILS